MGSKRHLSTYGRKVAIQRERQKFMVFALLVVAAISYVSIHVYFQEKMIFHTPHNGLVEEDNVPRENLSEDPEVELGLEIMRFKHNESEPYSDLKCSSGIFDAMFIGEFPLAMGRVLDGTEDTDTMVDSKEKCAKLCYKQRLAHHKHWGEVQKTFWTTDAHCNRWVWCGEPTGCHDQTLRNQECRGYGGDLASLQKEGGLKPIATGSRAWAGTCLFPDELEELRKEKELDSVESDSRNKTHVKGYFTLELDGTRIPGRVEFELYEIQAPVLTEAFRLMCTGEKGVDPVSGRTWHYEGKYFTHLMNGEQLEMDPLTESPFGGGYFQMDDAAYRILHHDKRFLINAIGNVDHQYGQFGIRLGKKSGTLDNSLDHYQAVFGHIYNAEGQKIMDKLRLYGQSEASGGQAGMLTDKLKLKMRKCGIYEMDFSTEAGMIKEIKYVDGKQVSVPEMKHPDDKFAVIGDAHDYLNGLAEQEGEHGLFHPLQDEIEDDQIVDAKNLKDDLDGGVSRANVLNARMERKVEDEMRDAMEGRAKYKPHVSKDMTPEEMEQLKRDGVELSADSGSDSAPGILLSHSISG